MNLDLLWKYIEEWFRNTFVSRVSRNSDAPDGTITPVKEYRIENVDLTKPFNEPSENEEETPK